MNAHLDAQAVTASGPRLGLGKDINDAVLAATQFGQRGGLRQQVKLSFSCKDLPNMDVMSRSDPFCILYKMVNKRWQKIDRTEVIHDNLNPEFVKKIVAEFYFERQEKFKVEVYDVDDDTKVDTDLSAHDFIGSLEFELH